MTIIEKFFSFQGRLARLPYFVRGIQLSILFAVVFAGCVALFSNGSNMLWWLGLALVSALAAITLLVAVSLLIRRLHDLGMSSYHAIWAAPALLMAAAAENAVHFPLMLLPPVAVSLWLTFWPGEKSPNRFDT